MNDVIAEETLEDHKYLLLEVQNRAAIAYFAAANRNLSLFHALKKYCSDHRDSELEGNEGANNELNLNHLRTMKNFKTDIGVFNKYSQMNLQSLIQNKKGASSGNSNLRFQTLVFLE